MSTPISVSTCHELQTTVRTDQTVPALFPDSPSVASMPAILSTPALLALMEHACILAAAPHLAPGEITLGAGVELNHTAPTPVGSTVRVIARCTEVSGRRSSWSIEAHDEAGKIGTAHHRRVAVLAAPFEKSVSSRPANQGSA